MASFLLFSSVCVCALVGGARPRLLITQTKVAVGDLRVVMKEEPFLVPGVLSRSGCQRGELLHPLMNSDCWSTVWLIEFPINYPEVSLRQISSSSSLLFFSGVLL